MYDNQDGLICAMLADADGGAEALDWDGIDKWRPGQGLLWVHFDYTAEQTEHWLREASGLAPVVADALLMRETRPRCVVHGGELLMSLRGVNMNPAQAGEEMVAIRLWSDGQRVISTRHRRLRSVDRIREDYAEGRGPTDAADLAQALSHYLHNFAGEAIEDLEDRLDALEEDALEGSGDELRQKLLHLRREVILLRRYLAPQRDALNRLWQERLAWMDDTHRVQLREVADIAMRQVEDLDALRDRGTVLYEELGARLADQMNRRMYVLSLIAGLFLPLGFVTGLLGINVGGMPGAENPLGFVVVVLLLVALGLLQWRYFRTRGWV